jgi:hypothetical protein
LAGAGAGSKKAACEHEAAELFEHEEFPSTSDDVRSANDFKWLLGADVRDIAVAATMRVMHVLLCSSASIGDFSCFFALRSSDQ